MEPENEIADAMIQNIIDGVSESVIETIACTFPALSNVQIVIDITAQHPGIPSVNQQQNSLPINDSSNTSDITQSVFDSIGQSITVNQANIERCLAIPPNSMALMGSVIEQIGSNSSASIQQELTLPNRHSEKTILEQIVELHNSQSDSITHGYPNTLETEILQHLQHSTMPVGEPTQEVLVITQSELADHLQVGTVTTAITDTSAALFQHVLSTSVAQEVQISGGAISTQFQHETFASDSHNSSIVEQEAEEQHTVEELENNLHVVPICDVQTVITESLPAETDDDDVVTPIVLEEGHQTADDIQQELTIQGGSLAEFVQQLEEGGSDAVASSSKGKKSKKELAKIHKCPECNKYFPRINSLQRHILLHMDDRPFQCTHCESNYKSQSQLQRHLRIHTGEKPAQCEFCQKKFRTYNELYCHRRTHTGEKPFECRHCGKAFSSRGQRNNHERIHTGEKPYECDVCGMRFTESSARRVHRFIHTGETPHKCKVCGRGFTQAGNLNKHMSTAHTSEKPHQCTECKKGFSTSQELQRHTARVHSSVRPHKCPVCDRSYALLPDLNQHMATHCFQCSNCKKKFKNATELENHLKEVCMGGNGDSNRSGRKRSQPAIATSMESLAKRSKSNVSDPTAFQQPSSSSSVETNTALITFEELLSAATALQNQQQSVSHDILTTVTDASQLEVGGEKQVNDVYQVYIDSDVRPVS